MVPPPPPAWEDVCTLPPAKQLKEHSSGGSKNSDEVLIFCERQFNPAVQRPSLARREPSGRAPRQGNCSQHELYDVMLISSECDPLYCEGFTGRSWCAEETHMDRLMFCFGAIWGEGMVWFWGRSWSGIGREFVECLIGINWNIKGNIRTVFLILWEHLPYLELGRITEVAAVVGFKSWFRTFVKRNGDEGKDSIRQLPTKSRSLTQYIPICMSQICTTKF